MTQIDLIENLRKLLTDYYESNKGIKVEAIYILWEQQIPYKISMDSTS